MRDPLREPPLARHLVYRTSRIDEASELSSSVYCPIQLRVRERQARVDAQLNAASLGVVTVGYARYEAAVHLTTDELVSSYHVNIPLTGRTRSTCGGQEVISSPTRAAVFSPGKHVAVDWERDCAQLAVKLERRALEQHLERLLGRPVRHPIRFDLGMDLTTGLAASWLAAVRWLVSEFERSDGIVAQPVVAAHLENVLLTGLLLAQRHDHSDSLAAPQAAVRPGTVKRAVDIIEARADEPLTVAELASAVGRSVRSLEAGFQRYVGMSPMSYLRQVRLARVHHDLLAADLAAGVTVTEVATRWGFTHLGRFAAAYQERYGEPPSQTLRSGSDASSKVRCE